ncbi:nuclear transport factor 2 family protein [Nonlabens sp. SCSIO 43208]|uniref:nuclear transport factor 2 family protein n=1 Tax=Nonlabens sp. SCSIO 43208 TaxID=2793009 RepID=UPI003D6BB37C
MQKTILYFVLGLVMTSCATIKNVSNKQVNQVLDDWHNAAARADYETYFSLMTQNAVFIGTDATENWSRTEFEAFSKPYFDHGKAWSFTPLERNIYTKNGITYFDELLETQMGICRGSGVLFVENNQLKIAHYVLSIAVPNENVKSLTQLKKDWDQQYISKLKN